MFFALSRYLTEREKQLRDRRRKVIEKLDVNERLKLKEEEIEHLEKKTKQLERLKEDRKRTAESMFNKFFISWDVTCHICVWYVCVRACVEPVIVKKHCAVSYGPELRSFVWTVNYALVMLRNQRRVNACVYL